MYSFHNIIEIIQHRAEKNPDALAYKFLTDGENKEENITNTELFERISAYASKLQEYTKPGDRVLLLFPPSLDYIISFYSCLFAGVIAVPAYPPDTRNISRIQTIINDADAQLALSNSDIIAKYANNKISDNSEHTQKINDIKWLCFNDVGNGQIINSKKVTVDNGSVAFLQYTSGSTNNPKGVMVTHQNIIANCHVTNVSFKIDPSGCVISWLPPFHDMGLIGGILQPVYAGVPGILMSPMSFLKRPVRWLNAITKYSLLGPISSGAPNFAYDLCVQRITEDQIDMLDLTNWRIAFSGAEQVRSYTLEKFHQKFKRVGFKQQSFFPVYGLAEGTLLASAPEAEKGATIKTFDSSKLLNHKVKECPKNTLGANEIVGCGSQIENHILKIVDPDTCRETASDAIGEIWLKGPSNAKGYWNNKNATEQTFGAYIANTGEGPFLRTGDMGFLHNNQLYITSRIKDLIIIRGRNHFPHDIELTVEESHPLLRKGNSAAFSIEVKNEEKLVIVQEIIKRNLVQEETETIFNAIAHNLSNKHNLQAHAILLIEQSSIPKTSSGKIQRQSCKKKFLNNELIVVESMITDPMTAVFT